MWHEWGEDAHNKRVSDKQYTNENAMLGREERLGGVREVCDARFARVMADEGNEHICSVDGESGRGQNYEEDPRYRYRPVQSSLTPRAPL